MAKQRYSIRIPSSARWVSSPTDTTTDRSQHRAVFEDLAEARTVAKHHHGEVMIEPSDWRKPPTEREADSLVVVQAATPAPAGEPIPAPANVLQLIPVVKDEPTDDDKRDAQRGFLLRQMFSQERIAAIVERAEAAFWRSVADEVAADGGDLDPQLCHSFTKMCSIAVEAWIDENATTHDVCTECGELHEITAMQNAGTDANPERVCEVCS